MANPEDIRAAYDAVAGEYAERFSDELAHKPLDCELLRRFAGSVAGSGPVYDLGCGPGHITAFLGDCGAAVRGLDLSPALVAEARRLHPEIGFEEIDLVEREPYLDVEYPSRRAYLFARKPG